MLINIYYNWWVYRRATPKYRCGRTGSKPTAKTLFMPQNERSSTPKERHTDKSDLKPGYVVCSDTNVAPHRRVACSQSIYYDICMVRPSPARRYIQCTATRNIFRRPHEESSAHSGTTCIIIAESAKHTLGLPQSCLEKGQVQWLQTLIAILVMLPLYLEMR